MNNELGDGFLESVYENALYIILTGYGLCVERQKDISVFFRGKVIGDFKADLIVDEKVIIELKAVRTLDTTHEAQLINYLKARPPPRLPYVGQGLSQSDGGQVYPLCPWPRPAYRMAGRPGMQ